MEQQKLLYSCWITDLPEVHKTILEERKFREAFEAYKKKQKQVSNSYRKNRKIKET